MIKGNEQRYGLIAKILHWLIALLILGLVISGTILTNLAYDDPVRAARVLIHRTVGCALFTLMLIRLLWRFVDIRPAAEASLKGWEKTLSQIVHWAFYPLLLTIPILGYLFSGANGNGVETRFGTLPSIASFRRETAETLVFLHQYITYFVLFLVFLHVAGALKHYFIDKNNIIKRMW